VKKVALATAFFRPALLALDRMAMQNTRTMSVEIVAGGRHPAAAQAGSLFARQSVAWGHPKRERP
jgi:hypothetical protein